MKPLSWKEMVVLHYGPEKSRKTLRENLEGCWKEARKSNPRVCSDAYGAMEELYDKYKEDCMRIIIFSVRNRNKMKKEGFDLIGLKKCINEWDSQSIPSSKKNKDAIGKSRRDSLTELILSYEDLRGRNVYMIAAIIQRVRRLRKATDGDISVLSYSNSLLNQAWKIWEENKEEIKRDKDNFMAAPNEMSDIAIIMQMMLNQARLSKREMRDYDENPDNLIERLEEYQKRYEKNGEKTPQYVWAEAYRWWFQRIKFRRAQKTLDFVEAGKIKDDMSKRKRPDGLQEYVDVISGGGEKEEDDGDASDPYGWLKQYHNLIVSFMQNPNSDKTKPKWKDSSLKEKRRYLELAAFPGGTRLRKQKVHQFIETTNLSPIRIVDGDGIPVQTPHKGKSQHSKNSEDWREDRRKGSLIQKCRVSISNSLLMTLNIGANNSHIAPATLILNAIDLMVKVRWFLSTKRIYRADRRKGKQAWIKEPEKGKKFRDDHEFRISNEIKDGLILALREIESELGNCEAYVAREPISEWVKSLEDLKLEDNTVGISSLGQLCGHCGILIGWEWQEPSKDTGREGQMYEKLGQIEGKKERDQVRDEIRGMQTVLLLKDSSGKEMMRIDTSNDQNPYLRPVGEISSHQ